jgi:hypothetical protein
MLRVAVAATSLFTCPACATTTTALTRLDAEAIESADAPGGAGLVRQAAAPAPEAAAPRWWQNPFRPAATDAAALAAWEQSRAAGGWPASAPAPGPPDSRLRLVLNMPTTADEAVGGGSSDSPAVSSVADWLGSAAFWPAPAGAGVAEAVEAAGAIPEPAPAAFAAARELLAGPAATHNTPEPGALALVLLGLSGVGVLRRLRRA